MSGGRFWIEVFPRGQIMDPYTCLDGAALGSIQMFMASSGTGKTPMARKVHASFTKFQALVTPWDRVAEGAYHQLEAN